MLKCLLVFSALVQLGANFTERPIIGIMTMELEAFLTPKFPGYDSYIAASYVKALESSGARVIPVFIGRNEAYYRKIAGSVNGILIPGGGARFNGTNNFFAATKTMFNLALEMNANNIYFPVFGVCLGFELLIHLANNYVNIMRRCDIIHINMPIKFTPGFKKGMLYRLLSKRLKRTFQKNITVNNHVWCIYPEDFNQSKLDKDWKILSTTEDLKGVEFISSFEHKKYPISGVQFHPEKNSFEWGPNLPFPHSEEAVEVSRYFYDWLVREARKNDNHFSEPSHEQDNLVYNFLPVHSGLYYNINFTQTYLFKTKFLDPQCS